jgi:DNA-binding response OmpR family regulator
MKRKCERNQRPTKLGIPRSERDRRRKGAADNSLKKTTAVLTVDATSMIGDALNAVFSTAGYLVERVTDADLAWTKLSGNPLRFDVVIVDHEIVGPSALEVVGRLRDAHYPGRIIVHASAIDDGDAGLYRAMGVEKMVADKEGAARLLSIVKAFHRQD